ncbi:MAG: hypothetical protein QOH89_2578 [Pseudonocardiales bacterium]|nr:hypothetical protein [Pseudonocardiales bacterium]
MTPPTLTGEGGAENGVEELASPERRSTSRRLRLDIAVGGAGLIIVLLLTRHHGGGEPAATTATPTASTSSTARPSDDRLGVYPVPDRAAGNAARCPDGFDCLESRFASAGTRAALEAAFPGARITSARTVRTVVAGYGQSIWTVDLRAVTGDEVVTLRLQPRSPADVPRHGTGLFGGHAITHWEGFLSQLLVVIDVVAPADHPAPLAAIEQLAGDSRMLSPS